MNKLKMSSGVLLIVSFLLSCSGSSTSTNPPDSPLMNVLEGDWIFYRVRGEKFVRSASEQYFHFEGSGSKYVMKRACAADGAEAAVTFTSDGLILSTKTAEELTALWTNGRLVISPTDGTSDGYYGVPVAPLTCAAGPDGVSRVARQTMSLRISPLSPSSRSAGRFTELAGDATYPVKDHLQQVAGTLLPNGPSDNAPHATGSPISKDTQKKDANGDYTVTCTDTPMAFQKSWSTLKLLADRAPSIYPGALIQGGPYQSNQDFILITTSPSRPQVLTRAPISINVSGPVFNSGGAVTTGVTVNDPSQSKPVNDAIATLLQQGGLTGNADFSVDETVASSEEQIKVELGVAGKVSDVPVSASAEFSYGSDDQSNYVLFVLNQVFFTAYIDNFNSAMDAFDPAATDPPDPITKQPTIRTDNPPLYVSQVDYGRMVMIQAISSYSSREVMAAVSAAASAEGATISGNARTSYEDTLDKTTLRILIKGGKDSTYADWKFLPGGSGKDLYKNLSSLIVGVQSFDNQTPYVPLAFTLNYLVDDGQQGRPNSGLPAGMLYTTSYNAKECSIHRPDQPVMTTFTVKNPDDTLKVSLCGQEVSYNFAPGENDKYDQPKNGENSCLRDFHSHQWTFSLDNKATGNTGVLLEVYVGGKRKLYRYISGTGGKGRIWDMAVEVNAHGTLKINGENQYYAASPFMSYETSDSDSVVLR